MSSHFTHWAVLPAELLAIPVPNTSWAFEEKPVMSLREWEAYRCRTTSTVILTANERNPNFSSRLVAVVYSRVMSVIAGLYGF